MANEKQRGLGRREMMRGAALLGGGAAALPAAGAPAVTAATPDVYTKLGVEPFINATATLTINGGSRLLPEVIAAIEQASHFHVNMDELMEKASARLAELLGVEWGIVTAGAAAALTHATAACIVGSDPEKMQQLPDLRGLKNQVIFPKESRNVYDQATRALGVEVVEVSSAAELEAAIGPRTAMIQILGQHFGKAKFGLEQVAPVAQKAGVPILVDAAADYLIVPNPYLARGASLVAYSGGKILRGPSTAGLLIGRKDLVRAAWANSAPHHAIGRAMKVSKEEIVGMVTAVEAFLQRRDLKAEYAEWERWYGEISAAVTQMAGVTTKVNPPAQGGPFPTLTVSWDPRRIGYTAGEVGRMLATGKPRIMTHAAGEGSSFVIRPVSLRPGDHLAIAARLAEIFRGAPAGKEKRAAAAPAGDLTGRWEVEVRYQTGSARHKLFLQARGNAVTGTHMGWANEGRLRGGIDGAEVSLRSTLAAGAQALHYHFSGKLAGNEMAGSVDLGEYGKATWTATRAEEKA
ncbi:MAG: hypothetical protein INH40_02795 [Acidobacteriaceae bacterium]|nr:hypothetical protein [Acidobacteriaceae bacterium]